MKTSSILLGSVATLSLAGAIALATPVVAQSDMNPPQYSSPAERAETQQLNEQNMNGQTRYPGSEQPPYGSEDTGTYGNEEGYPQPNTVPPPPPPGDQYQPGAYPHTSPDGNYGPQGPTYGNESNDPQSDSPPDAAQQRYQQQMQQYQDQQQDYQDQRSQYNAQQQHYQHELRWYDQARWNYDYPHAYAYEFDEPRLVRLYLMAEPSQQLADVPVEGPNGVWVGRVRNVETAPDGRPLRVEIVLNHRVSVWVSPRDLRFDPSERVVYTNLTRQMLWDMPGATVESGPA